MRRLRDLSVPQDGNDSLFPDGQIRNETATQSGTPVVREIYGDVITNIYKIIRDAGIDFNDLEDNESNGYQLLQALKVFSNELNDLQQVINVGVDTLELNFDFDNLPDNYVLTATLSDNLIKGTNYTIIGQGDNNYSFTANEFIKTSSKVILILSQTQTQIINLSGLYNYDALLTPFNGVISFNSTDKVHYLSDGYMQTNVPESYNIQQKIRVFQSDNDIIVYDAVIHKDKLIAMAKAPVNNNYVFYVFLLDDLNNVEATMNITQDGSNDFAPTLYADSDYLYLTNLGNRSANDNDILKIEFDDVNYTLSDVSQFSLESSFQKTSNAYVKNDSIITFINGSLDEFTFSGSTNNIIFINNVIGQLFVQNEQLYFTSGEIAMPWNV